MPADPRQRVLPGRCPTSCRARIDTALASESAQRLASAPATEAGRRDLPTRSRRARRAAAGWQLPGHVGSRDPARGRGRRARHRRRRRLRDRHPCGGNATSGRGQQRRFCAVPSAASDEPRAERPVRRADVDKTVRTVHVGHELHPGHLGVAGAGGGAGRQAAAAHCSAPSHHRARLDRAARANAAKSSATGAVTPAAHSAGELPRRDRRRPHRPAGRDRPSSRASRPRSSSRLRPARPRGRGVGGRPGLLSLASGCARSSKVEPAPRPVLPGISRPGRWLMPVHSRGAGHQ